MSFGTQVIGATDSNEAYNKHLFNLVKYLYKALNGQVCYAGSRCLQHTEIQFFRKSSFVPKDDDIFVLDEYEDEHEDWTFFTPQTLLRCLSQCTYTPEQFSLERYKSKPKKYSVFGYNIDRIYELKDDRQLDENMSCQIIVVSHKDFYRTAYNEWNPHRSFSRYIVKNFDLSIVQCYFDLSYMKSFTTIDNNQSTSWGLSPASLDPYIKVQYLEDREDDIRNKRMTYYLSAASNPNTVRDRLQKYEQRGYKCTKFVFRNNLNSLTISAEEGINLFRINEQLTLSVSSLVWTHDYDEE